MTTPPDPPDQPWTPPDGAAPPPPPTPPPAYGIPPGPSHGTPPPPGVQPPPYGGGFAPPPAGGFPPPAPGGPFAPPPTPPAGPASSKTAWIIAGAAVLVVIIVGAVVFAVTRGDDTTTVRSSSTTTPIATPDTENPSGEEPTPADQIEVDGSPLPEMDDFAPDDPAIGRTVPTMTGADAAGGTVIIRPGQPQIIVVMAHWCPHCQAEIPRIVEWHAEGRVPDEVQIVGVSTAIDEVKGNYPPASWLEKEEWTFPTLQDDPSYTALTALGVNSFPTLIAVGADGRVALRISGEADRAQFDALVSAALEGAPSDTGGPTGDAPCPAADMSSELRQQFDGPPIMCIDPAATYRALVTTNVGNFEITFDAAAAPLTVNNFVFLARYHFYDGLTFHRVIRDFMIQGGDPDGDGTGGPGYEFADELPTQIAYQRYSVAMANAGPDTNGSQFFIVSGPQGEALSPDYSLFGTVTAGTEVIDAIQSAPTSSVDDRPRTPIVMQRVEIVEG